MRYHIHIYLMCKNSKRNDEKIHFSDRILKRMADFKTIYIEYININIINNIIKYQVTIRRSHFFEPLKRTLVWEILPTSNNRRRNFIMPQSLWL